MRTASQYQKLAVKGAESRRNMAWAASVSRRVRRRGMRSRAAKEGRGSSVPHPKVTSDMVWARRCAMRTTANAGAGRVDTTTHTAATTWSQVAILRGSPCSAWYSVPSTRTGASTVRHTLVTAPYAACSRETRARR